MNDEQIVQRIIKRHGTVIDLKKQPAVMVDIIRQIRLGVFEPDGGAPPPPPSPPGGAPKPPPPDPSSMGELVRLDDLMKALLKVSRDVAKLSTQVAQIHAATTHAKGAKPG
ncbi:MAG: hypothetical protein JSR45_05880 [Proteobacteria bacterium]|nr:hypothetical protein [Pseudomonadota bacterium]